MNKDDFSWNLQQGIIPHSPVRLLLGWELLEVDPDAGTLRAAFQAKPEFLNPLGVIQGGMLVAMLDNVLAAALAARLPPGRFPATVELKTTFIRSARPGRLLGFGSVISQGRVLAFLEGHLEDADGRLIAKASATARIIAPAESE